MSKMVHEIKHARGVILSDLRAYYPNGLSGQTIFTRVLRPIFPGIEWDECFQHLTYLRDRQYIETVSQSGIRSAESPREWVLRLTPTGLDLAAGVTSDPGVLVEG